MPAAPYTGRVSSEANAYLHQRIDVLPDISLLPSLSAGQFGVAIIGYAVDEGVRLNQGRTGAAQGPAALRARLGREISRVDEQATLVDVGDLVHEDGETLFDTLLALSNLVTRVRAAGYRSVVLGGGHDLAAGHYLGLHRHDAPGKARTLGVVNFDAHLDLRPLEENGPNSGTPFSLIAQLNAQHEQPFRYACVGMQDTANTRALRHRAEALGVAMIPLDAMDQAAQQLNDFAEQVDALYVTIDLDGFPSSVSPGVSAPGVDGLSYRTVRSLLGQLVATGKVIGFDLAECNPEYDIDDRTARLGARLLSDFLSFLAPINS